MPVTMSYTGTYDWIGGITLEFSGSTSYEKRIPVGLSETVQGIGPALTEFGATVDASFAFTLSLGWGSSGATCEFTVNELEFDAAATSSDMVIPFLIGDLEAAAGHPEYTQGSVALGVHVNVLQDVEEDYEVQYDPVGDAVSHVDVHLPIYAALAGADVNQGETGTIDLEGDLFLAAEGGRGSTAVATASSHLDDFVPFTRLRLSDLRAKLESLRDDWFDTLAASDSFNVAIPFIDASLADLVDLGAAFDLAVLSKIDFDQIRSLQDFVAVVTASGLIPAGQAITYNTTTRTLAVPLDFEIELSGLSLRDLDALGRIDLQMLADEGLIQIGSYVDPDDLLDHGYLTLAGLVDAGILNAASVENWDDIDVDALIEAGVVGQAALEAKNLILPGDVVDMDALIDEGLVTLGDLIEAGLVTTETLVGSLGFIRDLNLLGSNIADLGADLASRASLQDLVSLDDLLTEGVASLGELFDTGLLDLGDLNLDSLGIEDVIGSGVATLQELVGNELVAASDFLSSTLVDIGDLLTDTASGPGRPS